ncbi:nose resistant to fluoxetine protein 6-like [Tropilaelaps mercedesae]|uniref:Nose resistant to fluoxetine protein 6-like n=1 Tax=Tropilaelaps mercedesae TaxID=418985 RepID=A0A1V9X6B5_9ACAR|nr:nose resistant to fluoxetine protein 6-like [Tropilaelaps mercedesae]
MVFLVFDSTGRPDSGVLTGGFSFLGFYSECLHAAPSPIELQFQPPFVSRYCMATLNVTKVTPKGSAYLPDVIWNKTMEAHIARIGLCVPSLCSPHDISELIAMTLKDVVAGTEVISTSCSDSGSTYGTDRKAIMMTGAVLFFIALAGVGTLYHFGRDTCGTPADAAAGSSDPLMAPVKSRQSAIDRLLMSFSVLENGSKILSTAKTVDGITSLHGLRLWSMLWIIFGHSYSFAQQWVTYRNTDAMKAVPADIISQGIANGTLSVDTFFFISGLLVVYVTFSKMDQDGGRINVPMFYFHRYWRMTPLMLVVIGLCANVLPYVSGGPRWSESISTYDVTCQKNWWINALYLQNFVNTPQMCLNHTWYSAVDMQFYIVSPVILLVLYKNRTVGLLLITFLGLASMAATAIIIAVNNYPAMPYISNIVPLESLNGYSANVYIKPYCRMGPYLVGMVTGYVIHQSNGRLQFTRRATVLGWVGAISGMLVVLYAMWNANTGVSLPPVAIAALYGACSRTLWAVGLSWIVLACLSGHGGVVNSILSWKGLVPFSRLTYSAYIIHPVVMAIFYGSREGVFDYTPSLITYFALGNIVVTYLLSFVMSLVFESPLIGIERVLFFRKK